METEGTIRVKKDITTNKTAMTIKVISIILLVIGIVVGIITFLLGGETGIAITVAFSILSLFVYGFGEIIQKLQNIEDNTKK